MPQSNSRQIKIWVKFVYSCFKLPKTPSPHPALRNPGYAPTLSFNERKLMKFVNILRVIYISFYSLTSRTRNKTVELIVRKYLLLWWSFCALEVTFYNVIQFQDKNKFKCINKAAIEESLETANSNN